MAQRGLTLISAAAELKLFSLQGTVSQEPTQVRAQGGRGKRKGKAKPGKTMVRAVDLADRTRYIRLLAQTGWPKTTGIYPLSSGGRV